MRNQHDEADISANCLFPAGLRSTGSRSKVIVLLSRLGPPAAAVHVLIVGRSRNGSKAAITGEHRTSRSAADASSSRSSSGALGTMRFSAAAKSSRSALVTASSRREPAGRISRSYCPPPRARVGGRPGAGFAQWLTLPVSNDTLLRVVRQRARVPSELLRVIGIDDFAWRRNHRYGTIVCDLERRRPIVMLPDRGPATSEAWLCRQQLVQTVTLDRGGGYGEAMTRALPQAVKGRRPLTPDGECQPRFP